MKNKTRKNKTRKKQKKIRKIKNNFYIIQMIQKKVLMFI